MKAGNGFALVLKSPYLRLVALLLVLLNIVNTVGEFILGAGGGRAARTRSRRSTPPSTARRSSAPSTAATSSHEHRRDRAAGVRRLPARQALRAAGRRSCAAPRGALRLRHVPRPAPRSALLLYVKVAENSTDYSVMNTAKQMIWLPTSREEKYKAKQAIDTFFVRAGDMLAAGVVFLGTHIVHRGVPGFARLNMLFVALAVVVAVLLVREHRRLTAPAPAAPATGEAA